MYLDNVLQTGTNPLTAATTVGARIGAWTNGLPFFNGSIDEAIIFNRTLSSDEITSLYNLGVSGLHNNITDGNVLDMRFEGNFTDVSPTANSGVPVISTTSYDFSNNNNDGTYMSNAYSGAGLYDNGLVLDGDDDGINISDNSRLSFTDGAGNDKPFSISFWTYPRANPSSNDGWLVSKRLSSKANSEWQLIQYLGNLTFMVANTSFGAYISTRVGPSPLNANSWYHVVATYNGSETNLSLKIYVNGVESQNAYADAGNYVGMSDTVAPVVIGYASFNNALDYYGDMDEIMIFNTSLTSAQISAIYNNQSIRYKTPGTVTPLAQTISAGNNKVTLSFSDYERFLGSNISARINYYNNTNLLGTTDYQNITDSSTDSAGNTVSSNIFYIDENANNLTVDLQLQAGTNLFYSPVISPLANLSEVSEAVVINVSFISPTTETGNYFQNWIYANISLSNTNGNTIYLYNMSGLVNSSSLLEINFTSLLDGTYYLNATGVNPVRNVNTETRTIILDTAAPSVLFNYQYPSDLNLTNFLGSAGVNISYNISDSLIGLNSSTITLRYKTNSTQSNNHYYQNGTARVGYFASNVYTNTSNVYVWNLLDNQVLPGTYNFGEFSMENTVHLSNVLSGGNKYLSVELFNVSNDTQYNFYEIMVNSSTGNKALKFFYCNSSYSTGVVASSINCYNFYALAPTATFNHGHTVYSKHQVIPFAIDTATGSIGTIKVTPTSYFLIGSSGSTVWNYYYINNATRDNAFKTSTTSGSSWVANNTISIDAHLHQYGDSQSLWYYACANDTLGNENCTSPRQDLFELAGLPPISPYVYSPTNSSYTGDISINYTAAFSPNNYEISYYNISLLNEDESFNSSIIDNNGINLGYIWDSSGYGGIFIIKVEACDVLNQCSFGLSENFTLDKTYPSFSNNLTNVASDSEYNPGNNYQFNITIANSNGTAGIEFNGVNYSLSNVSNSFYWNAGNLGVGNYNYYFWSYGSGALNLFNISQSYSYFVIQNNSYSLSLNALPNWNIVYGTQVNVTAGNCPSPLVCNLYRNGTEINSENAINVSLAAGTYNYTYNGSGNINYSASSTSSILTVSKNSSYVLSISGTTPINYGIETDVAGSNCPSQLTCSLDKANGIYGAGIVIFNYSTAGNENYTGSSATFEVTINKVNSQTSLVFDKTSPQTYLTEITPTCSVLTGVGTPILTLNEGVISSGIGIVLGAATHSFNCSLAGSQNYTSSSNSSSFVIDKAVPIVESSVTTPITYLQASDYNANATSSGDNDCTFNLYRNNELIDTGKSVSDNSILGAGVYEYVYNNSECSNWTSTSDTKTLTVNANNGNCNILFNETSPLTYPDSFTVYSDCSSDYTLYRNGSIILNGSTQSLAAGTYNFSVIRTDNENYSNTYDEEAFTIDKANIVLTKLLNGDVNNLSITYPQQINATAYSSQGTVNIFRDSIDVTAENGLNVSLAAGTYIYKFNVTGNENYTDVGSQVMQVDIAKTNGLGTLLLNGTENNLSLIYGNKVNVSFTNSTGASTLLRNNVDITSLNNQEQNLAAGYYNFTLIVSSSENYSEFSISRFVNISKTVPSGILTSSLGWSINESQEVLIGYSETNLGDQDLTYKVYRNNADKNTGETWTPAYGTYNYLLNTTGGENYTSNSSMNTQILVVNDIVFPLIVYGNGTEENFANFSRNWIYINTSVVELNFANLTFKLYNTSGEVNSLVYINSSRNINFTNLDDEIYYYNATVCDLAGNCNSTETRRITLDTTAPVIGLISPESNKAYTSSSQEIEFVYNASELYIESCSLVINNVVTNSSILAGYIVNTSLGINNSFKQTLIPGNYNWSVICEDISGNSGSSISRTLSITAPSASVTPTPSAGGGGGGGGAVATGKESIVVDVSEINLDMILNSNKERVIKVTNDGDVNKTVYIRQQNLNDNIVLSDSSITLQPGESKDLKINVFAKNSTGIFAGKIFVNSKEILVSINVKTKELLFDASIVVPEDYKRIAPGTNLNSQITLIPMGEEPRLDVTLNYVVKDYDGKTYRSESETILVEGQKTFTKEFYTKDLPTGNYLLGLELVYPNGVATSSSHFEVYSEEEARIKKATFFGSLILLIAIIGLAIGIIIRYKKQQRLFIKKRKK
jgi:hypothetical protein